MRRACLVLLIASLAFPDDLQTAQHLLGYNVHAPLHLMLQRTEQKEGVDLFSIEYDSPRGGRVTGFLVQPRYGQNFAGIVFGHWGQGDSTEFIPEAIRYAHEGAVSIMIDYPWVRPYPWYKKIFAPDTTAEQDRDLMAQAIVDLRRAFDVLLSRSDVDPKRVAYIGHSYGSEFGAVLSAIDRRMAACVLIAGYPTEASIWLDSNDPQIAEMRKAAGVAAMKSLASVVSVFDGIRFVGRAAPIPLLFQFPLYDRNISQTAMRAYFAAASEPKLGRWYSAGHEMNGQDALQDRASWLQSKINLKVNTREKH